MQPSLSEFFNALRSSTILLRTPYLLSMHSVCRVPRLLRSDIGFASCGCGSQRNKRGYFGHTDTLSNESSSDNPSIKRSWVQYNDSFLHNSPTHIFLLLSISELRVGKGVSISIVPSNSGDSVAASICNGTLPLGLALNAATEIILGSPFSSVLSPASVTIEACNALGNCSFTLEVRVLARPTVVSYPQTEYVLAVGDSITLVPTDSGDAVVYSLLHCSLPEGLQLNPDTVLIRGTSTASSKQQSITVQMESDVGSEVFHRSANSLQGYRVKYTLVNGKRYSLIPSYSGDEASIQFGAACFLKYFTLVPRPVLSRECRSICIPNRL